MRQGKAGLYCDTVPSQATIRPEGAQARGRRMLGRSAAGVHSWRAHAASGRALQEGGTGARGAAGTQGPRASRARGARSARQPGNDLGVQLGQWVVQLVHSACFDPI